MKMKQTKMDEDNNEKEMKTVIAHPKDNPFLALSSLYDKQGSSEKSGSHDPSIDRSTHGL